MRLLPAPAGGRGSTVALATTEVAFLYILHVLMVCSNLKMFYQLIKDFKS